MARPQTKKDLLTLSEENFSLLNRLIDSLPEEDKKRNFSFIVTEKDKEAHWSRDKNIRDVLAHLYEWHILLINWIESNLKGEKRPFLISPYTWKTYAGMNEGFFLKHQTTSYWDAVALLIKSHKKVMNLLENFSDEELFTKSFYSWTGSTSVGSYFVSATSSHYDWAIKKVKRHIKSLSGS